MFTAFHLFQLLCEGIGIVVGGAVGRRWHGWVGLLLGGMVGYFIGLIFGRVPYAISTWFLNRSLERSDVATLRSRLEREYYISHLIISHLLIRGEPVESFRDYVAGLCQSDSPDRRRFGEHILWVWPEMASTEAQK